MKRSDTQEAADIIRRLLAAVERGELDATAMERNALEGAALALDAMATPMHPTPKHEGDAPPE